MCFPFVVSGVSWRQANSFVHNNDCSSNFFLSFILSLQEKEMIIEYDGVPHRISSTPYLNVVPPFVVKNTIKVSARQEVFFRYDDPKAIELLRALDLRSGSFSLTAGFQSTLQTLRRLLAAIHTPGSADRIDLLALQMASEASIAMQNQVQDSGDGAALLSPDKRIFQVADYFAQNYASPITIRDLVAKHNMSPRNFNREWNKFFSVSPNQYLINLRLERAKTLLIERELSIAEIAALCGFCDSMYFARCFKQKLGLSPREYRSSGA